MKNRADKTHHEDSQLQAQDTASEPEWAIEPSGAPEEFGFLYRSAPLEKARVWDRQEAFLVAYRDSGKIGKAAKAIELTRWAVDKWLQSDVFGFRERMKAAHVDYCEDKLEARMEARLANPEGNRGSDILLMFQLKAEMPSKYREEVKIVDTSATKDLLEELRRLGRARVVEGSVAPQEPTQEPK